MLFSYGEWIWCSSFKNLQAIGYQVPPSVDTGCFPWTLTKPERYRSATNMFLSFEIDSARISLLFGSMVIHNQMYSDPTLISVSSTMNSTIFFFLEDIFFGWYFWTQFYFLANKTWFRRIKHDSLSETRLKDSPEKYKYKPLETYSEEGVLFLSIHKWDIGCLQAVDLLLNEQNPREI